MTLNTILISQPEPAKNKSPYAELEDNFKIKIDFQKFITIEGVSVKEFRKTKINLLTHTAVIFTSKTSVDNYFRMAQELRIKIPTKMKYFCINETIAYYLQKYIIYRKRKINYANGSFDDVIKMFEKYPDEKILFPVADIHKPTMPNKLKKSKLKFTKAVLYRTVSADLSNLKDINYDLIVFFSPAGIKSLLENFPDFKQNKTKIAAFGTETCKAVKNAGLNLEIKAPTQESPSMAMAISNYLTNN